MRLNGKVDEKRAFWTHRPVTDADWRRILARYGGSPELHRCLDVAAQAGCRTIVVENRYVDADYRSEYSSHWSLKFASRPAFTWRMHFFADRIPNKEIPLLNEERDYLGYTILRPLPVGTVGRTVLRPPRELIRMNATLTMARDRVSVFGSEFLLEGVPFYSQDGEYIRCAHAAAWVCHYIAATRGIVARQLTSDIARAVPAELSEYRQRPSAGMTYPQLQAVFHRLGHPAEMIFTDALPLALALQPHTATHTLRVSNDARTRRNAIHGILRRYLDSGLPVLLATAEHVIAIVGYYTERRGAVRFVACDDQVGPYEVIDNLLLDPRGKNAEAIIAPLPPRAWLPGQEVENDTYTTLHSLQGHQPDISTQPLIDLGQRVARKEIQLRSFLLRSNDYKNNLIRQGRSADVVRALRLANLSHWIWVVEAHGTGRIDRYGAVHAEFVYDSTSSAHPKPHRLACSYPGLTVITTPDDGRSNPITGPSEPWHSHLRVGTSEARETQRTPAQS